MEAFRVTRGPVRHMQRRRLQCSNRCCLFPWTWIPWSDFIPTPNFSSEFMVLPVIRPELPMFTRRRFSRRRHDAIMRSRSGFARTSRASGGVSAPGPPAARVRWEKKWSDFIPTPNFSSEFMVLPVIRPELPMFTRRRFSRRRHDAIMRSRSGFARTSRASGGVSAPGPPAARVRPAARALARCHWLGQP